MATPQPTFAMCCIWLTILMVGSPAACAEPPKDEPLTELAVLEPLVGSWGLRPDAPLDGFSVSVRQECKWILNKQFLEIDTHLLLPGHPPSSWRTLITYDQTSNCYRQWKFSDNGDVSTAHGAWNEKTSSLILSGRTPNSNGSKSKIEIIDDNTMRFDMREFLDDTNARMATISFTLSRVPPTEDHQLTK
ncbi:MAG: DUF1579 family protein [Planctomycetaceae bacterium]